MKQIITVTSLNHAESVAMHKAIRECVWLKSMSQHIRETCPLSSSINIQLILYENNTTCITQIKGCHIKECCIK